MGVHGRVVQVDPIKTRVESAYCFGASSYNMMNRCQTSAFKFNLYRFNTGSARAPAERLLELAAAAAALGMGGLEAGAYTRPHFSST
jgi:hypothetical protein